MKKSKKITLFIALLMMVTLLPNNVVYGEEFSESKLTQYSYTIPVDFIAEAVCAVEETDFGDKVVVLTRVRELISLATEAEYEKTSIMIFPDSQQMCEKIVQELSNIKRTYLNRGSGQYTDSGWYHGDSLMISSTIYYSTTVLGGILYGRIDEIYVECSVTNRTVIDGISLTIGQLGFTYRSGYVTYREDYEISNRSTTAAPASWEAVYWDSAVNSVAGCAVNVTVHRGTSPQYTYTFNNNII